MCVYTVIEIFVYVSHKTWACPLETKLADLRYMLPRKT